MATAAGEVRIGASGWRYEPWRIFYPPRLPPRSELAFASRMLPSFEINRSFYSLQRPEFHEQWHVGMPPGFVFALKGSRYITHMLKLRNIEAPLANVFASGVLRCAPSRGRSGGSSRPCSASTPIVRHLLLASAARRRPPCTRSPAATTGALPAAPGSKSIAPDRFARRPHPPPELRRSGVGPLLSPPRRAGLRRHGRALAAAREIDRRLRVSAPARRHGALRQRPRRRGARSIGQAHRGLARRRGVGDARLASPRPGRWRAGRDVYFYFANDVKVHAPYDAAHLAARLGVATGLLAGDRFGSPAGLARVRPRRRRCGGLRPVT